MWGGVRWDTTHPQSKEKETELKFGSNLEGGVEPPGDCSALKDENESDRTIHHQLRYCHPNCKHSHVSVTVNTVYLTAD